MLTTALGIAFRQFGLAAAQQAGKGIFGQAVGNRGYRLAQLEAGIGLGRLYLATYAHLALGGRGFTFYDDLVTEHLSPRGASQTPMTLFAFGRPPESRR